MDAGFIVGDQDPQAAVFRLQSRLSGGRDPVAAPPALRFCLFNHPGGEKFIQQVGNDLNTAQGITLLYDALKAKTGDATRLAILADFDQVLSLSLLEKAAAEREKLQAAAQLTAQVTGDFLIQNAQGRVNDQITALFHQRDEAKKAKNYAEADRIRAELNAMGIQFKDIPGGVELL